VTTIAVLEFLSACVHSRNMEQRGSPKAKLAIGDLWHQEQTSLVDIAPRGERRNRTRLLCT